MIIFLIWIAFIHSSIQDTLFQENHDMIIRSKRDILKEGNEMPICYFLLLGETDKNIEIALNLINEETCLTFTKINRFPVKSKNKCRSFLIYIEHQFNSKGYGNQIIHLKKDCLKNPKCILKLSVQALGLMSSHLRKDRDRFVTIHEDNIDKRDMIYFNTVNDSLTESFGLGYDFSSITHPRKDWLSNNNKPTITSRHGLDLYTNMMGQKSQLSFTDTQLINKHYCRKCPGKNNCKHGGYLSYKDCNKCICPSGFTGNKCENIQSDKQWTRQEINTLEGRRLHVSFLNFKSSAPVPCAPGRGLELHYEQTNISSPLILCGTYSSFSFTTDSNYILLRYNGKKEDISFRIHLIRHDFISKQKRRARKSA
uniref:Metalloendopeptidase n=1 Tax=Parastrongyloides trichosuri TaxID=131310 RepID=A0A0N4Z8U0_PARTI